MAGALDEALGQAAARWVGAVQARARAVVAACAGITLVVLALLPGRLGLNADENAMFSEDVPYFQQRIDVYGAYPLLADPIVVVLDGETVDAAVDGAAALAARLREDPARFPRVFVPGGGPFFEAHGLLYLSADELEEWVDRLVRVQPYLAALSRDPSLRGFFDLLRRASEAVAAGELSQVDLSDALERVSAATAAVLAGRPYRLAWSDVILGHTPTPSDRRRFVIVQPRIDFSRVRPAEDTIRGIQEAVAALGLAEPAGVRVRLTGIFPLSYEEADLVGVQSALAGAASFLLVSLALLVGLRSGAMIGAALATLLVGLTWTAGFAALAVGQLNLVSVTFGVLFIGLSIDFAIHVCIRFDEMSRHAPRGAAMQAAARSVGGSLTICAVSTAIGFYAFVPTEYRGVAELGLIAGTGMFITLFVNLTLLPALLALGANGRARRSAGVPLWQAEGWLGFAVRHARAVVLGAVLVAAAAAWLAARLEFDLNPLRVRDASTDSVQVFNEMLAEGTAFPWNLNVVAPSLGEADAIAERLRELPAVDQAVTLSSYVPEDQAARLAVLADAGLLLGPVLEMPEPGTPPDRDAQLAAMAALAEGLAALERADVAPALAGSAARLRRDLAVLLERWGHPKAADTGLARLEVSLIGSLPSQLRQLRRALATGPVGRSDLPADLVEYYVAGDGRARVEVFPRDDLSDNRALAAYVAEIRRIAPDAFGEGSIILESGRAVVRSLQRALALAAVGISLLLLLLWRSAADAALVALPLGFAALLTAAAATVLGIPLNFANVIVIPLLLGMGVDSGVHMVHRQRREAPESGNLLATSTARAVWFSALTTVASFGTLGFATHSGMASLGRLLALGIALVLVSNLILLPALVRVFRPR